MNRMHILTCLVLLFSIFTKVYSNAKWTTYLFKHDVHQNKITRFKTTKLTDNFGKTDILRAAFKNSIKENGLVLLNNLRITSIKFFN